ncbi:RNA polymerase sigma-70 factor [Chitinophaga sp. G-6-1-13]|uniref:RNA polymerase sigma-70 factor n=1 Tax=Chitinophaga fulva TaxID=2728842 RepID=A0A848GP74_9BACT|nr:RNA polymerase sigma-70 factor [Chitinophaga fulva]NML38802.1 RNA polymerase sigma-70 factor [Chitinophaga fulva]
MTKYPPYSEPTAPVNERLLLELIASGDERAFGTLYELYWRKVFTYLLRLTKSRETAEELLSEIFTKFWSNRATAPDIRDVDAFLATMTYHKAIDFFRLAAKEKKIQQRIAAEIARHQLYTEEEQMVNKENTALLREAISELSPQRKLVFTLSREHGLTHQEIARQLNMSPHTVKKTMSNAIKTIRAFLSRHGLDNLMIFMICYFLLHLFFLFSGTTTAFFLRPLSVQKITEDGQPTGTLTFPIQ